MQEYLKKFNSICRELQKNGKLVVDGLTGDVYIEFRDIVNETLIDEAVKKEGIDVKKRVVGLGVIGWILGKV